ncbi:hypothetical protein [Bacillus sp. 2205SS5-2]|uniref:hypothetical protein n=1 Tax=Bacillus sp. 2205SS5-2 TaxID=3109031 RepID=UPI0030048309
MVNDSYAYDALGRLKTRSLDTGATKFKTTLMYEEGINNGTTNRVKSIKNKDNQIDYTYDPNGNIKSITEKGKTITYTYNEFNELIRENTPHTNKTFTYEYDTGGNILFKKEYTYSTGTIGTPTETITYSYHSTWKDKLEAYNERNIIYDSIGNPIFYAGPRVLINQLNPVKNYKKGRPFSKIVVTTQTI